VYVNGEKVSTTYIDGNTLSIKAEEISEGDTIVVNQLGSSNTIFRSSNEYIFMTEMSTENTEEMIPSETELQTEINTETEQSENTTL
ncbi:MAG: hypothetical protein IKJ01_02850, partial [Lachnospiraceae bacterium]|nr:hypothetical protein [Lachnospiraceae bacterium]